MMCQAQTFLYADLVPMVNSDPVMFDRLYHAFLYLEQASKWVWMQGVAWRHFKRK